jgi:divalent metal cation (Fe/Co/Zn/Cd) transporter
MFGQLFQSFVPLVSPAEVGWSDVVKSMEAAFSDPKHVIILGIVAGSIVVLYVNYRVARWLEQKK